MYIARQKRRENIAEYILYLWQIEDLLRALGMSPDAIWTSLVDSQDLTDQQKQESLMWYVSIGDLLKEEGKIQHGHLRHSLHLISDLQDLHGQLMKLPVGENYRMLYARLVPELPKLREAVDKQDISDIELCFRALYAVMLYRMKGLESGAVGDVLEYISPVIAELAKIYRQVETGEIDLFENNDKA